MDVLLPSETGPQCHVPCTPKWPTAYVDVQSRVIVTLDPWREPIKYGLRASLFQYDKAQVDQIEQRRATFAVLMSTTTSSGFGKLDSASTTPLGYVTFVYLLWPL